MLNMPELLDIIEQEEEVGGGKGVFFVVLVCNIRLTHF